MSTDDDGGARVARPETRSAPVLTVVRTLATTRGGLEARLLEAARVVVAACCEELLVRKGFSDVEELTTAQRRRWRAEGKAAAVDELVCCLGVSATEARDLVGLALAGGRVPTLVISALEEGRVSWWQVRMFWSRCGRMPVESAELVATALLGTQADLAHPARLDPDGTLSDAPWEHHAYRAALAAEATRIDGKDPAAERARRRAAYEARHASMVVHDDGTASLTLTGDLIALVGAYTRVDRIARLMRKRGDERTLSQLAFDVAAAFLVHGVLPVLEKDPDDLTDDDLELLARVATAQPQVHLDVVVPLDTVTGSPACPSCGHGYPEPDDASPSGGPTSGGDPPPRGAADGHTGEPTWPPPGWAPPREGGVAEVVGRHPAYLTPEHTRELACRPGTTIHRLLTDARDGRLVERSQTTYRPDAAMRAQVAAADRYCRGPRLASRRPAPACEIDHVVPFAVGEPAAGGRTTLANLVLLGQHPHHRKTRDELAVTINERRDLTWTTLLAQTVSTRSFDYRELCQAARSELGPEDLSDHELLERCRSEVARRAGEAADELLRAHRGRLPRGAAPPRRPTDERAVSKEDRAFLRDVAARALYAALVHRDPGSPLADADDQPGATGHGGPLAGWMFVRPPAGHREGSSHPTPEQVLGMPEHPGARTTDTSGQQPPGVGHGQAAPGEGDPPDTSPPPF